MNILSVIIYFLISINILLLLLLFIINKKICLNKKILRAFYLFFILLFIGLCLVFVFLTNSKSITKSDNHISNESSLESKFEINNSVEPNNKKIESKNDLRTTVYNVVSEEFGENFKYTKDFLLNSDGTYTVSLLFDDVNYSEDNCKNFLEKLSNKLKSFKNVGRIEVYFLNNFKIKYSLTIDDFNNGNTSVIIKEDAF